MILQGDCLRILPTLPEKSFHTCVTSPPYWGLRDYGIPPSEWPEVTYTPMPGLDPISVSEWTGCLGLEPTPEMFVAHIVHVFRLVQRTLRDDGTLWLNFGDSYWANRSYNGMSYEHKTGKSEAYMLRAGAKHDALKPKDLMGIPWRVAFALQADGWYLRSDIVWHKPNAMPESVRDRPTKSHEYIFLLSKSDKYYYDYESIKEQGVQDEWANGFRGGAYTEGNTFNNNKGGNRTTKINFRTSHVFARKVRESPKPGEVPQHREDREPIEYTGMRNKRSVWTVATQPFPEAHFATFPEKLIEPCIIAGSPMGGVVLDPFGGSGTTLKVALQHGRECTVIELGDPYIEIAKRRTEIIQPYMQF